MGHTVFSKTVSREAVRVTLAPFALQPYLPAPRGPLSMAVLDL